MPIISLVMAVLSCVFAYFLQKKCPPDRVKLHGEKLGLPTTPMVVGITDVYVKDDKYFAHCIIRDTGELADIEIDKAMMASVPDQSDDEPVSILIETLVYAKSTSSGIKYELAPEEIRFKLNIRVSQQPGQTFEQIEQAKTLIAFYYEIRLIFWTLAFVGVYSAPRLSFVFSLAAMLISWENIMPNRFANLIKCGIINIGRGKNSNSETQDAPQATGSVPPGFERWSDDRKYMHSINQQMTARRSYIAQITQQGMENGEEPDENEADEETEPIEEPQETSEERPVVKESSSAPSESSKPANRPAMRSAESHKAKSAVSNSVSAGDKKEAIADDDKDEHEGEDPFGEDVGISGIEQDELDDGFSMESSDDSGDYDDVDDDTRHDTEKASKDAVTESGAKPDDAKSYTHNPFKSQNGRGRKNGFSSVYEQITD